MQRPLAVLMTLLLLTGIVWTASAQEATPEVTAGVSASPEAEPEYTTYTIQPGDTLGNIASRFGVTARAIMALNDIANPELIYAGQTIRIPVSPTDTPVPTMTDAPTEMPLPTETPAATEAVTESPTTESTATTYVVQRGDTLASIARRFRTTVNALISANDLSNANVIIAGQTLIIPGEDTSGTPQPTLPIETAGAPEATEASALVPDYPFDYGVEAVFSADTLNETIDQISGLSMNWVKLVVNWRDVEPAQGEINFSMLDDTVAALNENGLDILLTVTAAPAWARQGQTGDGAPDDFTTYAAFLGALAERYNGIVHAYEVWLEPNLRANWNSSVHEFTPAAYLELLRQAYVTVKAADPAAVIVSAGLAPTEGDSADALDDRDYLLALYEGGLTQVSDAVGAHPRSWANPPDALCCEPAEGVGAFFDAPNYYFLNTLSDYRGVMTQHGDSSTDIWITAFGWAANDAGTAVAPVSPEDQALYTARAYEIGAQLGFIGPMFVSSLNGCQAGTATSTCAYSLLTPDGEARPVYGILEMLFKPAS